MKTGIVIVAAGRGARAGGPVPKQWQRVAGKPVARWTVQAFEGHGQIVVVLNPSDRALAQQALAGIDVIFADGGESRADSVLRGLDALVPYAPDRVLIHDVARPCVSENCIENVLKALETSVGAAPALPVTDALWTGADGAVSGTQDRSGLYRAQTPQGFHFDAILRAHRAATGSPADDVEVARAAGLDVAIVSGEERNLKITSPADFARAAKLLETAMDVRLGNGYDVHAFEDGDHVILCGVAIPHDKALKGHSDADVAMHAVTDAIYGALAQGDIGRHFPPSDPQWKGAPSDIFLRHACALARSSGYEIGNLDITIICELPKIGPHAAAMIQKMTEIVQIAPSRISVKATTSERLGFTGRGEGIASIATATLVTP